MAWGSMIVGRKCSNHGLATQHCSTSRSPEYGQRAARGWTMAGTVMATESGLYLRHVTTGELEN